MIDPNLLVIKPVGELENVVNPTTGEVLYYDGSGDLKKTPVTQFFQMLNAFAKPLKTTDSTPTVTGWYKPTDSGLYNNAGGLEAQVGYDTLFYFSGTMWTRTQVKMPNASSGQFILKPFNSVLDLSVNNYYQYKEIFTNTSFTQSLNRTFGEGVVAKLTGGSVSFDSDFIAINGSQTYNPAKTNIITFFSEYDKVRYIIDVLDFEPFPVAGIISYYSFNGKPANALLTSISPNNGVAFVGDRSRFKMNSSGSLIQPTSAAASELSALAIDKGSLTNYRVTFKLAFNTTFQFAINADSFSDFADYVEITKGATSTVVRKTPSNPGGVQLGSTTAIPPVSSNGYIVEILVDGATSKLTIDGSFVCNIPSPKTGHFFSFIFISTGDLMQFFKMEEL